MSRRRGGLPPEGTGGPPIIAINGANSATIAVGTAYADLGGTIAGPTADLSLGIQSPAATQ